MKVYTRAARVYLNGATIPQHAVIDADPDDPRVAALLSDGRLIEVTDETIVERGGRTSVVPR